MQSNNKAVSMKSNKPSSFVNVEQRERADKRTNDTRRKGRANKRMLQA